MEGERGATGLAGLQGGEGGGQVGVSRRWMGEEPTSLATANASSDKAVARSVLPHQASSRASEPRPLIFHIG